jgi:hypothetical protein
MNAAFIQCGDVDRAIHFAASRLGLPRPATCAPTSRGVGRLMPSAASVRSMKTTTSAPTRRHVLVVLLAALAMGCATAASGTCMDTVT